MFLRTVLALCSNRNILASEHPTLGGPQRWFSNQLLEDCGLIGLSFDFFVNWEIGTLDRELWIKCPLSSEAADRWSELSDEELVSNLRSHKDFVGVTKFSRKNSCEATAVIFDDRQTWGNDSSLILARWPKDSLSKHGLEVRRINIDKLSKTIIEKSGGPIRVGSKGLSYGTSRLECYLSKTSSLWPGDVDFLICKKESLEPIALIEFKKHTKSSSIPFDAQQLKNYYPEKDARKYDRLAIFSSQICPGKKINFYNLYYSTINSDHEVILEEVVGVAGGLSSGKLWCFDISSDTPEVYLPIIKTACQT